MPLCPQIYDPDLVGELGRPDWLLSFAAAAAAGSVVGVLLMLALMLMFGFEHALCPCSFAAFLVLLVVYAVGISPGIAPLAEHLEPDTDRPDSMVYCTSCYICCCSGAAVVVVVCCCC